MALNLRPANGKGGPRGVSNEQMAEALRKNAGNVLLAANALGVTDSAIYHRIANHPDLGAIKAEAKAKVTDMAEARIMKRIERDDWNALNLWMTTQAGWTKKTELTGPDGAALQLAPAVNISVNYVGGEKPEAEVL